MRYMAALVFFWSLEVLGAGDGVPIKLVLTQIFNFTLTGIFLYFVAWKPVNVFLEKNRRKYLEKVKEASKKMTKVGKEKEDLVKKIKAIKFEENRILAKKEGKRHEELLKAQTEKESQRLREKAKQFLNRKQAVFVQKIKAQLTQGALSEAQGKIVSKGSDFSYFEVMLKK